MRLILLFLLTSLKVVAQDIVISSDTTVNNTWTITPSTRTFKIINGAKISGTGTIIGGVIQANKFVQVFDTTLTVRPYGVYSGDFSMSWYGASASKLDNSRYLQIPVDVCIATHLALEIQPGNYKYSTSLMIGKFSSGAWQQVTLKMYGSTTFWDSDPPVVLNYEGIDSFAIGMMKNKGSELSGLKILGKWLPPNSADTTYYNIPYANFTDRNGVCSNNLTGLAIDPLPINGSTGLRIHNLIISQFSTLIGISQKFGYNADILKFYDIQFGDGRVGFQSSQPQEKGNAIANLNCWGNLHTLFQNGNFGAGDYTIDGVNVAGRVVRLFNIFQSGWFSSSISNVYAERIREVGSLDAGYQPLSFQRCHFYFISKTIIGDQTVITSANTSLKFEDCTFGYYGTTDVIKVSGAATYENCKLLGAMSGGAGSIIYPPFPMRPPNRLTITKQ